MADDLYDAFGDGDVYFEDEEGTEVAEGEGQNRTFLILFGGMAALLACAIGLFLMWALVWSQPAAPQDVSGPLAGVTETPAEELLPTDTPEPTETATPEPTDTPTPTRTPTPTPVVGEPATPTPENGEGDPGGDTGGDVSLTPTRERRTATPTPTPRYTPTPRPDSGSASGPTTTPDTGFGEVLLILGGFLVLGMALMIRRLRKA